MRITIESCASNVRTNDTRYRLDDLLAEWHQWCRGFSIVGQHGTAPMFNGLVSSKQWDSESDVLDDHLHSSQMVAFDFHVNELEPLYRTAIGIQARNLVTGRSVWTSARLPTDLEERAAILATARNILINRLTNAGIL
jgi:hypothetical protein